MVEQANVDDAKRAITAHPSVAGPLKVDGPFEDGSVAISFDMAVRRPALGFQNGVRECERVHLFFPGAYPFQAPRICLRHDFCRALPHINPSWEPTPQWVEPCVIDERPDTFVRWQGLAAYLDRLAKWLDDAAHDSLRSRDGFWEPMRRNGGKNRFLAPVREVRGLVGDKARHVFLQGRFFRRKSTWNMVAVGGVTAVPIEDIVRMSKEDSAILPVIVAWAGAATGNHSELQPDRLMTLIELRNIAANFECTTVNGGLQRLAEMFGTVAPNRAEFVLVLAVRRPLPLQATHPPSNIELLPYLVHGKSSRLAVGRGAYVLADDSVVLPMPLHDLPSPELGARLSGLVSPNDRRLALLGCGSLGSKVAIHLGKNGLTSLTLIDSAALLPHNLMRMGVMFDPRVSGFSKVEAVGYDLSCIGTQPDTREENIVHSLTTDARLDLPESTVLALDTTASPNVHDALCQFPKAVAPARLAQAAFLARGRLGYFRLEGEGRCPDLEDLEAAMWRRWMLNPPIGVGRIETLTAIDVGQGCTSATMVMSDMAASLLAAGIARMASTLVASEMPALGRLSTAVVGADEVSVEWSHEDRPPSIAAECKDGWTVSILPELHMEIEEQVREAGASETGGYLLARVNWVLRRIIVAAHLKAPADSKSGPCEFVLGIEGAEEALTAMSARSMGGLIPVGTWHSHPKGGGPSRTDIKTLRNIAEEFVRQPAVGLIHRPEGYLAMVMSED